MALEHLAVMRDCVKYGLPSPHPSLAQVNCPFKMHLLFSLLRCNTIDPKPNQDSNQLFLYVDTTCLQGILVVQIFFLGEGDVSI